jgi:hypothetical protein
MLCYLQAIRVVRKNFQINEKPRLHKALFFYTVRTVASNAVSSCLHTQTRKHIYYGR